MSKASIPVIKFLFNDDHKVLGEALSLNPGFEVEEFADSNELSSYLSTVPAGLVVTSLKDRNDLIQIATFMKIGKKIAKETAIKVVVFNFSKDRNFEKAVAKLGILDLVEPGINTRALKFKLDFWMKSLNAQMKTNGSAGPQKVKSMDPNSSKDKKSEAQGLRWTEPLELEDDIWIIKNENDCKKVLSKWLVRLMGPSPYVGTWAEVRSGLWRFDLKGSEKEMFVSGQGDWFFSGEQKPDFVWKENLWLITGDSFDLYFKNGESVHSRLSCKNRSVTISKNSLFAKTKEAVIIESFDKELVFKRGVENLQDMEGENSTENINNGPLEGKNKTDELNGDPLKGKTKSGADKSENLSGKTKGGDHIEHENLEQKTSTGREKTHWANKNKYEEEESNGPLGVDAEKHREGSSLEREIKDREHKKYYKNHNEAEQYEAGELSGKSDTEKLKSHYGQKEKSEKPLNGSEEGDLEGKSSTDKLHSHYGKKEREVAADNEKERARKEKQEHSSEGHGREEISARKNRDEGLPGKNDREDKEFNERELKRRNEQESDEFEKSGRESGNSKTRKEEVHPGEETSSKTALKRNEGSDNDDGFKGDGATDKISGHYKSSRGLEKKKHDNTDADDEINEDKVVGIRKNREEKNKPQSEEELALEALTRDARVVSFINHKGRKIQCGLDDFFDDTIVFHTDDGGFETSAEVNLDMKFKFHDKDTLLKIDGNVLSVDSDGAGLHFVTVQLSKENVVAFDSFMKLYEERQKSVNEFLKRAKGA